MNFDSNALYRHPERRGCAIWTKKDRPKSKRLKFDLTYISLDGNIGCRSMARPSRWRIWTIKLFGGAPGNFLDVGGGADRKGHQAFKIMLKTPKPGDSVNIFGGIMKCDVIANGVIAACARSEIVGSAGRAHEGHERDLAANAQGS